MRTRLAVALLVLGVCCGCTEKRAQNAAAEDFDRFPFHQQTKYFDIYYQRDSARNAQTIRLADDFVSIVKRDFFDAEQGYPIHVYICADEARFTEFMHRDLGIPDASDFGIYVYSRDLLATYEDSGLGTFTHEAMHPLLSKNLPYTPPWAGEGVPTFFEKFYGYWDGGQLVVYWGYQNPWRIRALGSELTQLDLKAIVSEDGRPEPDESKLRMASVFLWQQGRLKRFLKLVQARDRRGYPTYFEAAMDMPMEKIVPLWQDYLQGVARDRARVLSMPNSSVFNTKAEFDAFVKANGIPLEQVKQVD